MATVQPIHLQDADGTTYTLYVETTTPAVPSPPADLEENDREAMGITEDAIAKLKDIHGTIRAYASYAMGAFKDFSEAEIEELNLKFGLKIGGKTGVPIITEGSAEANFEISVKCKFPDKSQREGG